ncbi:DUF1097 domain-containing protein [Clostridium magnum]|uniref:Inner membrane protein YcdZ n=1 Tax=Clostridium magnum DSM 2767 TaxID=1121326 RepID=A0A162QUM3_9CLOT|nr:DUF1097 domain-containing protein [Clostridium magnum]KZL88989.1 inner membrane protein YcdZ [Clostridium magnum DSM 2767]SHI23452.1 Protein of unknown function [Clostridium magnum DSM 2767]
MKQTLGIGISAGLLAALLTEIGGALGVVTWVGFVAMLSYYASGCGKDGFIRSMATNLSGVFWGWMIVLISKTLPIPYPLGVTVFLIVIVMCMQSYFSVLNFIPGAFAGCSCYFGTNFDAKGVIIALIVGNILAFASHIMGTKIGNMLEGKKVEEVSDTV